MVKTVTVFILVEYCDRRFEPNSAYGYKSTCWCGVDRCFATARSPIQGAPSDIYKEDSQIRKMGGSGQHSPASQYGKKNTKRRKIKFDDYIVSGMCNVLNICVAY